jgi:hypothetical protein
MTHADNPESYKTADQTKEAVKPALKKQVEQPGFFSTDTVKRSGSNFVTGLKQGLPIACIAVPIIGVVALLSRI